MNIVKRLVVVPKLPPQLERLKELAYNIWWSWDPEGRQLFRRLDPDLWERTYHNPVHMLGTASQDRLNFLADDEGYLSQLDRAWQRFQDYMASSHRFSHREVEGQVFAYFSAEYGLTECLPIYSGGLGVLSGDHMKAASDLGLPLVGVGLLYREGYFRQYLNADGWQQEYYPENDFYNMPVRRVMGQDGSQVVVEVDFPSSVVKCQLWRIDVGRIALYMLDTNHPDNSDEHKAITAQLYGGDSENRIRQEMILGIGGYRALRAIGKQPSVVHMNEGHAAFAGIERAHHLMCEQEVSFDVAAQVVRAGGCFTTHTPVPAGNDVFDLELIDKYLSHYYDKLGIGRDGFLALGRQDPGNARETFCMTVLALRLSTHRNGVSKLHGEVSRDMWRRVWSEVPPHEVPITSITNGVHTRSWISNDLANLYDRYLGPRWILSPARMDIWNRIANIPDTELWRAHERRRERLVAFARRRLHQQCERRGASSREIAAADETLDPGILTICFARRFATYKRATLLFRDPARLSRLVNDPERPIQIIFAGKAHPRDGGGKELIREIVHQSRRAEYRSRIVFLENYDLNVARYMLQGTDVWLNTPLRPLEASGTSGMKAAANGALNLSIPDGWWVEGYQKINGWNIGSGEAYPTRDEQDEVESNAIYDLLEKEIIPAFYDRGSDHVPREWVRRMKSAAQTTGPVFSTSRMVQEYAGLFYFPAYEQSTRLAGDDLARARAVIQWRDRLRSGWGEVRIESVETSAEGEVEVGESLGIRAMVHLGGISSDDVRVEVCYGPTDSKGNLIRTKVLFMQPEGGPQDGRQMFTGTVQFRSSGQQGFMVRILANHEDILCPWDTGLVTWAR
ncbi:MAG: alpha-glucan family phosphorylase [Anaerolineaceae bacterium]|nr:alpha-glucan family phosphorylase [Anaerolineaceae bacterium]